MKLSATTLSATESGKHSCLIVGVAPDRRLSTVGAAADRASGGAIARLISSGDFKAKPGDVATLRTDRLRVVVVGLGDGKRPTRSHWQTALVAGMRAALATEAKSVLSLLALEKVVDADENELLRLSAHAASAATYRFQLGGLSPTSNPRRIAVATSGGRAASRALAEGDCAGAGANLARHLAEQPPNVCTPEFLARVARTLGRARKLKVSVLNPAQMQRLGMGALLAVAQGSANKPRLITMEYRGGAAGERPVALVGKGVTFDTGGISLKPAAAMDEMKFDMCGAASVFGALDAAAAAKLPLNVVGIVPACENMPGSRAQRPGDVVRTMSGQTVEVLNTDAEGRLILADALTYSTRWRPQATVDIATLTGACVIALGEHASGLFSTEAKLARELTEAGTAAGDRAWELPLWDDYQRQLKSDYADMANIGGRTAGTITAACFLSRFATGDWAHLDIAGTAWMKDKRATGRPVPLLFEFLRRRACG